MQPPPSFARYYAGPEHQPFHLEGGEAAALLIHGFPGTPGEMLPMGRALHAAGWTVHGPLLPGFGVQIDSLPERRHTEWIEAVRAELADLRRRHRPVLLAGFSMGAALALAALQPPGNGAAPVLPDGLALLAPYWRLSGPLWSLLPLIRRVFPSVRPFRLVKVDFSDARMREGMTRFMPDVDLDDPAVQQGIRDFAVPVSIFDELRQAGRAGWQAAPQARLRTLVVQGDADPLVRPAHTRRLLQRLPGRLVYVEVAGMHDINVPERPGWPLVTETVTRFANQLCHAAPELLENPAG
jgi:carboxylesterase